MMLRSYANHPREEPTHTREQLLGCRNTSDAAPLAQGRTRHSSLEIYETRAGCGRGSEPTAATERLGWRESVDAGRFRAASRQVSMGSGVGSSHIAASSQHFSANPYPVEAAATTIHSVLPDRRGVRVAESARISEGTVRSIPTLWPPKVPIEVPSRPENPLVPRIPVPFRPSNRRQSACSKVRKACLKNKCFWGFLTSLF